MNTCVRCGGRIGGVVGPPPSIEISGLELVPWCQGCATVLPPYQTRDRGRVYYGGV